MGSTYALSGGSAVHPAVEGTLDAVVIFNLAAHPQVSSHVQAVALKGVCLSLLSSEDDDVVAVDIDGLGSPVGQFFAHGCVEPAVGEGRRCFLQVFLPDVVHSFDDEMRAAVLEVVEEVGGC